MKRREDIHEALCAYNLGDASDVESLGEVIADHLSDGMVHALLGSGVL